LVKLKKIKRLSMAKLSLQRRLAADILGVGESRVWLDPAQTKDIQSAVTRADVKKLISRGLIRALPEKLRKPKVRRKRKGPGRRRGAKYARLTKKARWISRVRPQRRMLRELRDTGQIDRPTYRRVYLLVKAGMFRSRTHLRTYLEQHGMLKK
jgi:large subunit ribosomal protein L19e